MADTAGDVFRALHKPGDPFILANAWDAGSARLLAGLGARAIGTTSGGHAFTLGREDGGRVTRDEALAHAQALVGAVALPVSADLENGFGPAPEDVAETVRLAGEAGLAGCSIEDIDLPGTAAYDRAFAVERIRAGAAAARALPRDFILVARADGVMMGAYDLAEAIARVRAFEAAGADCLYVPQLGTRADQARVARAVSKPVNALPVGPLGDVTVAEFAAMGVARISLGALLARITHRALRDAARAMLDEGRFDGHAPLPAAQTGALLETGSGGR